LNDDIAVLVAPTSAALADGILRLVENPDLRLRLGVQARRVAQEKFDPAEYLAKLDRMYQSLRHPVATGGPSE
jgi:glycosyltransferase involved in cell wall biosynthesis